MQRLSYLIAAAVTTLAVGSALATGAGDVVPCLDQILTAIKPAIETGPF